MQERAISATALLIATAALLGAGDSTPSPKSEIEVTTSGAQATFAPTRCGGVASTLSGRVVRRASSGDIVPVANASFSYAAHDGTSIRVPISVGADGRFEEQVVVMGYEYTLSSSALTLQANPHGSRLRLSVTAPGCSTARATFRPGSEAQDITLRCQEVP